MRGPSRPHTNTWDQVPGLALAVQDSKHLRGLRARHSVSNCVDALIIGHHPNGPATQPAIPNTEHLSHLHDSCSRFLGIMSPLPFLLGSLAHPSSKAFSRRASPAPGARIHPFRVFVRCCLPRILLSPSNSPVAGGRDLHGADRGAASWKKWRGAAGMSLGRLPAFRPGLGSLSTPCKAGPGGVTSKEKPSLFISHFLPYGCQMETGRDVIAQFTSSTALFFILILNFSESL